LAHWISAIALLDPIFQTGSQIHPSAGSITVPSASGNSLTIIVVSGKQYRSITFLRDIAVIDRTCVFSTTFSLDADRTCSFSGTLSLSAHRALKVASGTTHLWLPVELTF
jgi:hypothetical protein